MNAAFTACFFYRVLTRGQKCTDSRYASSNDLAPVDCCISPFFRTLLSVGLILFLRKHLGSPKKKTANDQQRRRPRPVTEQPHRPYGHASTPDEETSHEATGPGVHSKQCAMSTPKRRGAITGSTAQGYLAKAMAISHAE